MCTIFALKRSSATAEPELPHDERACTTDPRVHGALQHRSRLSPHDPGDRPRVRHPLHQWSALLPQSSRARWQHSSRPQGVARDRGDAPGPPPGHSRARSGGRGTADPGRAEFRGHHYARGDVRPQRGAVRAARARRQHGGRGHSRRGLRDRALARPRRSRRDGGRAHRRRGHGEVLSTGR